MAYAHERLQRHAQLFFDEKTEYAYKEFEQHNDQYGFPPPEWYCLRPTGMKKAEPCLRQRRHDGVCSELGLPSGWVKR